MVMIPLLAICRVMLAIVSPPNSSVHLTFSIAEKQRAVKGESLAFDCDENFPVVWLDPLYNIWCQVTMDFCSGMGGLAESDLLGTVLSGEV